jgi:hypothetical protein
MRIETQEDFFVTHSLDLQEHVQYLEIMKSRRKQFAVSKDRMLTIYPTLHEIKGKGILKRIIKKLIHIRKDH